MKVIDKSKGTRKNIDIVDVAKQILSGANRKLEEGGKSSSEVLGPKESKVRKSFATDPSGGHTNVPKARAGSMSSLGTSTGILGGGVPTGGQ